MIHETIPLTVPGADGPAELTAYAPGNFPELGERRLRSAVIICPGGGYHCLSDREGERCMSFWQKDEVYRDKEDLHDRCRILGGRSRIEPGYKGLVQWNFGTQEEPIIVVSGVELPEEAYYFEYGGDNCFLRTWVDPDLRTALTSPSCPCP